MNLLGIPQVDKEYKTPSYARNAQLRYLQRKKVQESGVVTTNTTSIGLDDNTISNSSLQFHEENKKKSSINTTRQTGSEACKKHRLKKKLVRIAALLDIQLLRSILEKLGDFTDDYLNDLILKLKSIISQKIEERSVLEMMMDGSKIQPSSIINVMIYHILKDKFQSLTHASEVLGLNVRTLSVNYKELCELLQQASMSSYKVVISNASGEIVKISYLSDCVYNNLLDMLPNSGRTFFNRGC